MINKSKIKSCIKGNLFTDSSEKNNKMLHIKLTRESNLIVVLPATANIMAKFANGIADDLASTTLIAANKKIICVPAMNVEMWNNVSNIKNINILINKGIEFIGPEHGNLSCGEFGLGRMSEKTKISNIILHHLNKTSSLLGKKCIVTAGPTVEPIDKIRYISNHSSGKQGYEIAKELSLSGAKVILITGPVNIAKPANVKTIKIKTANEMNKIVQKNLPCDIAIFTAAVSDIRPINYKNYKIKKNKLKKISFKQNPDIIKNVSLKTNKRPKLIIGFALETNNEIANAIKKIKSKECDWIVVNKLNKYNNVFGSDYNKVTFVKNKSITSFKKMTKTNVSKKIIKEIINDLKNKID